MQTGKVEDEGPDITCAGGQALGRVDSHGEQKVAAASNCCAALPPRSQHWNHALHRVLSQSYIRALSVCVHTHTAPP